MDKPGEAGNTPRRNLDRLEKLTMKHLGPVFVASTVASTLLLAACPATPSETTEGESSSSEGEESTTTGGGELTQTTPAEPTSTGETTATDSGDSESESMSGPDTDPLTSTSTGPGPECTADGECGTGLFCAGGTCVACDGTPDPDAACAGLGDGSQACVAGECRECGSNSQCAASTPVCDQEVFECVGCSEHADCPDSACNMQTGVCNDVSYVLYVDRLAVCDVGDGSQAMPYCKVGQAITKTMDEAAAWTIKIRAGNYTEEPLVIPAESQVTMTGWDGVPRLRAFEDTGPTLEIGDNAKVYLDRLQFSLNDSDIGVKCVGGTVWASDVGFNNNTKQGYYSTDCTSSFMRSVFYNNDGGGVESYGGTTTIVNSYVTGNGSQNGGDFGGIRTAQDNQLHLIYSTVVNNLSMTGPRSLHCTDDAFMPQIRNSVIIAFALPSVDCLNGTFVTSVLDEGSVEEGILVATMGDIANFFEPMVTGVYKAKPDTLMKDVAQWMSGDPKRDYNGNDRPKTDGALDWPGADVPNP